MQLATGSWQKLVWVREYYDIEWPLSKKLELIVNNSLLPHNRFFGAKAYFCPHRKVWNLLIMDIVALLW